MKDGIKYLIFFIKTPLGYYKRTCLFRQDYTLKSGYLLTKIYEMLLYSYNVITKKGGLFYEV